MYMFMRSQIFISYKFSNKGLFEEGLTIQRVRQELQWNEPDK